MNDEPSITAVKPIGDGWKRQGPEHGNDGEVVQQSAIAREIRWLPTGATEQRSIRVSVGLPEPHPTLGGYQCTLTVEGFGEAHSTVFHDPEGMLALTYTLNILPEVIEHLVEKAGGGRFLSRLRVVEDEDPSDAESPASEETESAP